jgi:hypothetical protein
VRQPNLHTSHLPCKSQLHTDVTRCCTTRPYTLCFALDRSGCCVTPSAQSCKSAIDTITDTWSVTHRFYPLRIHKCNVRQNTYFIRSWDGKWRYYHGICLERLRKTTSIRMEGMPAEIRTKHIPLERYCYGSSSVGNVNSFLLPPHRNRQSHSEFYGKGVFLGIHLSAKVKTFLCLIN